MSHDDATHDAFPAWLSRDSHYTTATDIKSTGRPTDHAPHQLLKPVTHRPKNGARNRDRLPVDVSSRCGHALQDKINAG